MRLLREYQCVARKYHFCDCCHQSIGPGEWYEGLVYATPDHIVVIKQHCSPPCDPEPDPFDEECTALIRAPVRRRFAHAA